MESAKKNVFVFFVVVVFVLLTAMYLLVKFGAKDSVLMNDSKETINEVYVIFNDNRIFLTPSLKYNEKHKLEIPENFEGRISLEFLDDNKNEHTIIADGYRVKGDRKNYRVIKEDELTWIVEK